MNTAIDPDFLVDTSLAEVDVDTLMTKAFELTHRLDALAQYNGTPQGARKIGELRDQRDAIVREMKRRSDAAERALVAVETTERVLRRIDATLGSIDFEAIDDDTSFAEGRVRKARGFAQAAMEVTTETTCSLVKNLRISDSIAKRARLKMASIVRATR
jgi:predicted phage gp36 major capsid-like protein